MLQANQRRVARVSKEIERNIGNLFLYDKVRLRTELARVALLRMRAHRGHLLFL